MHVVFLFDVQMDLGSSPTEIVERAMDSRELKHVLKSYRHDDLVLKVVGREEYMLKEKRISSYKVVMCVCERVCAWMYGYVCACVCTCL